jgi:L-seryl-tRNA(Ser) seleniumtransferase
MAADEAGSYSALPSVERVRAALGDTHAHKVSVAAARIAIDRARTRVRAGGPVSSLEDVVAIARSVLSERDRSLLTPVINATGVMLHTNLGRAPLGPRQLAAVAAVASGYSNLEYDINEGTRGSRYTHAGRLLTELTGAEAGVVVNNNAAAVLVTLAALCAGREVIISRGELIEIGGEFRIPDIMAASGARLVEVGTTNRTHLVDYETAITSETAAILKVHPSNYSITGFTASVEARDLARLARGRGVTLIYDVGSGLPTYDERWPNEPTVTSAIEDGADVVTFSGDKLLGGPQAGVIAGREELIDKIARHPMMRALRVDKMTLAALQETLRLHAAGATEEIPLWAMATTDAGSIEGRAQAVIQQVSDTSDMSDVKLEVVPHRAVAGGGSAPGADIASFALSIVHATRNAAEIDRALRDREVPVIARVEDQRVLVDLRTVDPLHDDELVAALTAVLL